jgi:prepilin-type processing-associated H-X9-DG protein
LIPVLSKAQRQVNRAHCSNNLKQLTLAWRMFAQDNDQKLCSSGTSLFNPSDLSIPDNATQYFDPSGRQWVCDGPMPWKVVSNGSIAGFENTIFGTEKSLKGGEGIVGEIGLTCSVKTGAGALWKYASNVGVYKCKQDGTSVARSYSMSGIMGNSYQIISDIYEPSEKVVFTDAQSKSAIFSPSNISFRHGGGCNLSFADGHCEYRKVTILDVNDAGIVQRLSDKDTEYFTPKLKVGQRYR